MDHASSVPSFPVTAFSQPLFTTMARTWPPLWRRTSRETMGAAWKVLSVKHAAMVVGRDDVDKTSQTTARSRGGGAPGRTFFDICVYAIK